jgi:hypothetical protein
MRLALVAFSAVALAAVSGCSSNVPATPDAAWSINMDGTAPVGQSCNKGVINDMLGDVNAGSIQTRVIDGQPLPADMMQMGQVTCSVAASGSGFQVSGSAGTASGSLLLQINIPMITAGATQASPASGSVTYSSAANTAGVPYSTKQQNGDTCSFYFSSGTQEGVKAGQIWGLFTCSGITDSGTMSDCEVGTSYFVFENCDTSAAM